jgi:chromatin structure-remodeling complex protein RSC7
LISLPFPDRSDTQPTSYRWEALPDTAEKRRVLGGTKTGNGAWALAWVDTVMEFPDPEIQEKHSADAQARERLWREVERAGEAQVVDLT